MIEIRVPQGSEVDPGALSQIENCLKFCDGAALMADHHKGYGVPIGGVVVSKGRISPTAVGYDIGCGNKAVLTDALYRELVDDVERIMDDIASQVSFGIGKTAKWEVETALFDNPLWNDLSVLKQPGLKDKARAQLGTVGSGNHYVDLFFDELGRVWTGVHFGSRGLGHTVATWFLNQMGAKDEMDADPVFLDADSGLGAEYIQAMKLAGEYAYAGRDGVCKKVLEILGASPVEEVHNHHNFAWHESHGGEDVWVCRKGATPAFPGQRGFVGATMGEPSVILEGVEAPGASGLFYSTVHGAGRTMSRSQATGAVNRKTGELVINQETGLPKRLPAVTREMMESWVGESNVVLRGAGVDESPHCYKRLDGVLAAHADTVRVLHTLTPFGVCMAGNDVVDPYKD